MEKRLARHLQARFKLGENDFRNPQIFHLAKKIRSLNGQMIGIIDSFEHLTFREKSYRRAKKPFDAMAVIKAKVMEQGKFCKGLFTDLCKSLG